MSSRRSPPSPDSLAARNLAAARSRTGKPSSPEPASPPDDPWDGEGSLIASPRPPSPPEPGPDPVPSHFGPASQKILGKGKHTSIIDRQPPPPPPEPDLGPGPSHFGPASQKILAKRQHKSTLNPQSQNEHVTSFLQREKAALAKRHEPDEPPPPAPKPETSRAQRITFGEFLNRQGASVKRRNIGGGEPPKQDRNRDAPNRSPTRGRQTQPKPSSARRPKSEQTRARTAEEPPPVTPPGEQTPEPEDEQRQRPEAAPRYVTEANRMMGKYVERPKTGHENRRAKPARPPFK